jgi:hypothetical protein
VCALLNGGVRKQYNFWPWPTDDGASDAWDVDRLIELTDGFPVKEVPIDSIWQLDTPHWGTITPRDLAVHVRLLDETDLAHPIILSADGRVMDGMHRVVKALVEGRATIAAVQFDVQPQPDFRHCRPEDLSYEETSE